MLKLPGRRAPKTTGYDVGFMGRASPEQLAHLRKMAFQPGKQNFNKGNFDSLSEREWREIMSDNLHPYGPGEMYMVTTDQLVKLEEAKAKINNHPRVPFHRMMVYRSRILKYANQRGLFCSAIIPDIMNTINQRIMDQAITRVYLQGNRRTVKASDMAWLFI